MSDLLCGKAAVGGNYNSTRDNKAIEKMKKYIGIEAFEAELILIDPKENVKAEDDKKIDVFCEMVKKMGNK